MSRPASQRAPHQPAALLCRRCRALDKAAANARAVANYMAHTLAGVQLVRHTRLVVGTADRLPLSNPNAPHAQDRSSC